MPRRHGHEDSVLRRLLYSRVWAQKQGVQPTGGAVNDGLALTGGTKSTTSAEPSRPPQDG